MHGATSTLRVPDFSQAMHEVPILTTLVPTHHCHIHSLLSVAVYRGYVTVRINIFVQIQTTQLTSSMTDIMKQADWRHPGLRRRQPQQEPIRLTYCSPVYGACTDKIPSLPPTAGQITAIANQPWTTCLPQLRAGV